VKGPQSTVWKDYVAPVRSAAASATAAEFQGKLRFHTLLLLGDENCYENYYTIDSDSGVFV